MSEMLTRQEAARKLGISPATLATWACRGRGPAFAKIGGAVRYPLAALAAYVEQRTIDPAQQFRPGAAG